MEHQKGQNEEVDLIDWELELEIELPPLLSPSSLLVKSSPSSSLVSSSSSEGASDPPVPTPRMCRPVPAPRMCAPVAAPPKCPPSHLHLPPQPHLAAPLLTLTPPSTQYEPHGTPPWLESPSPLSLAFEARTPHWPMVPMAPPWLLLLYCH
ncbi:uncharacterized protein LOC128021703 [Carassius gibelio]|uniref:uncharacterized protein LOC128021703 n=1 Tax=Carassius gibelio TaxID=101364 RepID=UPI002277F6AB|nr:uncharacterized protein LOC128021703 [Carassius gibelio]